MTGYATSTKDTNFGTITIEIKSVNSRFLDLQFKINDEFRAIEPMLREAITKKLQRGKVECRFSFGKKLNDSKSKSLNQDVLMQIQSLQQEVQAIFPQSTTLSTYEILKWPGVMEEAELNSALLQDDIFQAMTLTMSEFIESRKREGTALKDVLMLCIESMELIVARVTPLLPIVLQQFQQKAIDRLQDALGIAIESSESNQTSISREDALDRIRQEVTMYGIRIDVSEELVRLSGHLTEAKHILEKGGPVGKKLDFMMQELNREANTLGSKAALKELADASMELKLLIEQMREQVQNLE